MKQNLNKLACAAALTVMALNTALADSYPIYNNSAGYNGGAFNVVDGQQIGTEITLDAQTWALTQFQIEYYAPILPDSTVGFDVSIYKNNGPITGTSGGANTPGDLVYDGGLYTGLLAPGANSITYTTGDFGNLYLTGSYTFMISFHNTDNSGNMFGLQLPLADSPVGQVGTSYGDYWVNTGSVGSPVWSLLTAESGQANLVMNVEGTPEPSVMALSAVGGVLLLGVNKLRRKRA